ncbi:MAG TPA: hypothetical protein ENJ55_01325 [Rhizobiales bacterium]|nr:hypothetical protein [Hyphomicrobiales bacterium]
MSDLKKQLSQPLVAAAICSFLIFPARIIGREIALIFRRSIDYAISKNDTLFEFVARSHTAADTVRSLQAWSTWIVYGLVTAVIAMMITRWLTSRTLPWATIAATSAIWLGIYLLIWNWDSDLQFSLTGSQAVIPGQNWGPWPFAGLFGFFGGLITGLIFTARPWRATA